MVIISQYIQISNLKLYYTHETNIIPQFGGGGGLCPQHVQAPGSVTELNQEQCQVLNLLSQQGTPYYINFLKTVLIP